MKPVRHRLVRTHPTSGRKSLFLSAHIGTIVGWPQPEALAFIRDLMEHATQAAVRLFAPVDAARPGDLGQPHHHAPRAPLRRPQHGARPAPHHDPQRRPDGRAGGCMTVLPKRRVGKTKLEVTTLGLGGAPMGGFRAAISDAEAVALTDAAYDGGVRYFDTSPFYGYGRSELRMGAALRNKPREEFVLSTKIGRILHAMKPGEKPPAEFRDNGLPGFAPVFDYTYDGVMRSLEHSHLRLGLGQDRHRADPRRRFLDHQGPHGPRRALQDGDGRRLQGARRAAQRRRHRRDRRRHQRSRHQPALRQGRRLRLHAAGRPLHAARAGRARRIPAGVREAQRLGRSWAARTTPAS